MVVAVTMQYAIHTHIAKLNNSFGTTLASPTAFFIFWLLFLAYDNYVWKLRAAGIPFSRIPDFSGHWVGYIERRMEYIPSGDKYVQKIEELIAVQLYVGQTYRKISLRLRSMSTYHSFKGQESDATSVGIFSQDFDHPKLKYTWTRQELSGEGELLLKHDGARHIMEGNYSSNHPRIGFMRITRWEAKQDWYCGLITTITSASGKKYLGIHVPESNMIPYLRVMRCEMYALDYERYTESQRRRDDGGFHMTIFEPSEYETIGANSFVDIPDKMRLWCQLIGLGRQKRGDDETYYCVVKCEGAEFLRSKFGLGYKDCHITLGFRGTDLHGVPKGADTLVRPSALSRIRRFF
jgi:hypothetical protein